MTVAIHDQTEITVIWPGFRDRSLGVAFDVGSTTIAGHLCDLTTGAIIATHGQMNPQIRYGEDVMSRVSYAMMNEGGAEQLTTAVRGALDDAVGALVAEAGAERSDVLEITLVANPIMHHLVLGLDPTPLGAAPFALATSDSVRIDAHELGIEAHLGARVYVLPCIAGHVGADAAGAMLSEAPHRSDKIQLLVDVGTNAEIILGNSDRVLAASSPTGPAFEGCSDLIGSTSKLPAPSNGCGSIRRLANRESRSSVASTGRTKRGFEEEISRTPVTGICGSGIIEVMAELFLAGVITADGTISGEADTARVIEDGRTFSYVLREGTPRILITQADVRAVQLAKAALHAGARLLMDHFGTETVDQIRLAGAFGNHIDPKHAMVLGMIPDCDLDAVSGAGNAAGSGAIMALLSRTARIEVEDMVKNVEKIETATEPRFQEHFVAAIAIPHETADYPNLSKVVDLPTRPAPSTGARRRRRTTNA